MAKDPPITGTWDFFQDASDSLHAADMPHLLIGAQDGNSSAWNSANIQSKAAVRWFRERALEYLAELEESLED